VDENKEPALIVPPVIDQERHFIDFAPHELCVFIPLPNTVDQGFYVNMQDIANLLRANKDNPQAIQYIADMLGG